MDIQTFFVQVEVFFESAWAFSVEQPLAAVVVAVALLLAVYGFTRTRTRSTHARPRRSERKA